MEMKKSIFIIAFLITISLLCILLIAGNVLNDDRKTYVEDQMQAISDINDVQTYSLMNDIYGNKMACLAFRQKLKDWDKSLWDLGMKLEQYRVATEEFSKDPFYIQQKTKFNENELLYMLFLTKINKECNLDQDVVTFFYKKSEVCSKCDDQSFVLTDIKKDLEENVSIFSFDTDLNITNVQLLVEYYDVSEFPCVIINEKKFCGIEDKNFILKEICETNNNSLNCKN